MFCYISFSKDEQFSSKFFEGSFFAFQIQSTGQELLAFQVHPADLPRRCQQSLKFDRPSSLTQQQKPPGHKFTLSTGSGS